MKVIRVKQEYKDARFEMGFIWAAGRNPSIDPFFGFPPRGNKFDKDGWLITIFPFEIVDEN